MKKTNKVIFFIASILVGTFAGFSYVNFKTESSYYSLTSRVKRVFFSENDTVVANVYTYPTGEITFDSFNFRKADIDFKTREGFSKSSGGFKIVKLEKKTDDLFYLYRYEDDYLSYINPKYTFQENNFSDDFYNYKPPIENYRPSPEIGYLRAMKLLSKDGYKNDSYDFVSNFFGFIKELKVQDYYRFELISKGESLGNPYYSDGDFVLWYKEKVEEYGLMFQPNFYKKQLLIFVPIFILTFVLMFFLVNKFHKNIKKIIVVLLALILLLCLIQQPYDFYMKVRYFNTVGFIYLAIIEEKNYKKAIYFVFAILFQPFYEISFDKQVWHLIDLIIALWLLIDVFKDSKKQLKYEKNEI